MLHGAVWHAVKKWLNICVLLQQIRLKKRDGALGCPAYNVEKMDLTYIFSILYAGPRLDMQVPDFVPLAVRGDFQFYHHELALVHLT